MIAVVSGVFCYKMMCKGKTHTQSDFPRYQRTLNNVHKGAEDTAQTCENSQPVSNIHQYIAESGNQHITNKSCHEMDNVSGRSDETIPEQVGVDNSEPFYSLLGSTGGVTQSTPPTSVREEQVDECVFLTYSP